MYIYVDLTCSGQLDMTWEGEMSLKSPGAVLDVAPEVTAFTSQTNLQKNIVRIKRVISIKTLIALKRLNDVPL